MRLPNIDLDELNKLKEDNFKERLAFIDLHAKWLKKTSNKEWSSQQNKIIE